jgi:hypothetical protein
MATGNTIKCPNCGAPIENTSDESKVKCLYCGSIVEVPSEIEEEDWNQLSAAIGGLAAAISGDVTPKFLPPKIDDKECENKILEKLVLTDLVPLDIFESFKLEDIKHTFCPLYVFEVNWSADWSATFTTQVSHQERTYDYNGNPNGTRTVWETKYRDATGTSAGNLIVVLPASDEQKEMLATIIDHFKLSAYRRKVATEPNPNGYDSWDVVPVKCNSSEAWENNKSTAEKQIEQNVDDGCCNSASSRANGWSVSNLQYTWGYRMTSKQCVQIPVCSTKYKYNDALHGVIIDANDGTAILEKPPQSKDDVNYIKELATQNSKYKRMMIGWYIVSGIFVSIAITVFVVFLLDPIPLSAYGSMAKVGCIITIITFFIARRSHELKLNANNDNATFLFEKKTARKEAVKRKYKIDVNIGKAPEKKKTSRVLDFVVYGILLLLIIISSTVGSSKDNHRNVSYDESPVEEKVYEAPVLEETEESTEAEEPVESNYKDRNTINIINGFEYNAMLLDYDGDYTNIRNAPSGKVVDKLYGYKGESVYYMYLSYNDGEWWRMRDNKVYDKTNGRVRHLKGSQCWIHSSCFSRDFNKVNTSGFSNNKEEPYVSDSRILTENDIWGKSKSDIRIMRNEIYARHGYVFKSNDLQEYFSKKAWYNGTVYDANNITFNFYEKKNIEFLKNHE